MIEQEVEDYFKKQARLHGGKTRKVKWIGRKGAPDELVLLPDFGGFVELKRPKGGKLTKHQILEHGELRKAGFFVAVIHTKELVDEFYTMYRKKYAKKIYS